MLTKLIAIARKDALVRFSSPSELLFFVALPLLFTFTLGGGFGGGAAAGEPSKPLLLLVQQDEGDLAADLVTALESDDQVSVVAYDLAEAERRFADDEGVGLLLIPAGLTEQLRRGEGVTLPLQRRSNDNNAVMVQQVVTAALGRVSRMMDSARLSLREAEARASFASDAERTAYFEASIAQTRARLQAPRPALTVTVPETTVGAFEAYSLAAHQSAGQLITWVLIPLLGTSALLVGERTQGTLRRLFTLPVSNLTYLVGTILGQLGMAVIQMVLLVGFGTLVMGLNWGRSPLGVALMMGSFGLASVAMGTAIGTFTKNETQANNLSIMLGMVMALLGGCWWPRELFPDSLAQATQLLPTTWAMQGFTDLVIRGLGAQAVMPEAMVLLGFAALFLVIGVTRFRYE